MTLLYSRPRDGKGPQTEKSTNGKLFGRSVLGGEGSRNPDVYMVRYWFGPFRLHIMHRGDAGGCPHDHPWWFITFPLTSYVEEILVEKTAHVGTAPYLEKELNYVKAFRFHFRPAHYAHRILGPYTADPELFLDGTVYWSGITDVELAELRSIYPKTYGRNIRTLVLRGSVKWSWGFYLDWKGTWMKASEYFRQNNIQQ
jgi:hypothetical protein